MGAKEDRVNVTFPKDLHDDLRQFQLDEKKRTKVEPTQPEVLGPAFQIYKKLTEESLKQKVSLDELIGRITQRGKKSA